jgi:hypothetical protein
MSEVNLFINDDNDRLMTKEQRLYTKCQHCDVGELVDAVDTLRSDRQHIFIPKRKPTLLQKIGATLFCCCL